MNMTGKVLATISTTLTTRKGAPLAKTRLRLLDVGDESGMEVQTYWIDFLGDAAIPDAVLTQINHQEIAVEVRRVSASLGKDGRAYLNLTGGAVRFGGEIVQPTLKNGAARRSA